MRQISLFIFLLSTLSTSAYSLENSNDVRKGNRLYKKEKYSEAEVVYKKALEDKEKTFEANFNLGNALYRQERYDEALEYYEKSFNDFQQEDKQKKAAGWHNIGNSLLVQNRFEESIEAYKNALRQNPNDDETRYNLAFAQYLKKKMQSNNKQEKEQKNRLVKTEEKQDQNIGISKLNAEQILKALIEDEKETQLKINRKVLKEADTIEKKW